MLLCVRGCVLVCSGASWCGSGVFWCVLGVVLVCSGALRPPVSFVPLAFFLAAICWDFKGLQVRPSELVLHFVRPF